MKDRYMRAGVAVFALALVAAACSDSPSEPAASGNPTTVADDGATAAEDGPSVELVSPAEGAEVTSPVLVEMAANGFTIEPAGEVVEGAGHFHLLVDVGCMAVGETIPTDTPGYNHFGKAQTEAELELETGEHTICLQAADGVHTALDLTAEITITVVE